MATRLEQDIEELAQIVERCLGLCDATRNGIRCSLPANHGPAQPCRFLVFDSDVSGEGRDRDSSEKGRGPHPPNPRENQ